MNYYRRYRADPDDAEKTIDMYEKNLIDTNNPMWAIAIELSRIANAMEPDDNCENFFSQIERVAEKIELGLDKIHDEIRDRLNEIDLSISSSR